MSAYIQNALTVSHDKGLYEHSLQGYLHGRQLPKYKKKPGRQLVHRTTPEEQLAQFSMGQAGLAMQAPFDTIFG